MKFSTILSSHSARLGFIAIVLMPFSALPSYGQVLGPLYTVSNHAFKSRSPAVAAEVDGTLDIAWQDQTRGGIVFARSIDGGATFSPETIVATVGDAAAIGVAADGVIIVAWRNYSPYCVRSVDHGQTFSTPLMLGAGGINNSVDLTVTADGAVLVVWSDDFNLIQVARSIDEGVSFSSPVALTTSDVRSYYPRIASYGTQVQAAWTSFIPPTYGSEIRTAVSTDDGGQFAASLTMTTAAGGGSQSACVGVGPDGQTMVGWLDESSLIALRRSLDHGATFEPARPIIPVNSGGAPDVVVDDAGDVFLSADSAGDLVMSSSPNMGFGFTLPEGVSVAPTLAGAARLAKLPGRASAIVWEEAITSDTSFIALRVAGGAPTSVAPTVQSPQLLLSPNPTRGGTAVRIAAAGAGLEGVMITDAQGRVLRQLDLANSGQSECEWDGRDQGGRRVAAGVYLVRAIVAGRPMTAKIVAVP